ncbi:MAG: methyltransferase domain-containing protein [Tunicatimonas sp.]|uniref:class I SAM-dependent methyltransferase n=1 Tax=Tunicatimonas sp. TaxID=1940096 RepID=UPI003C753491
MKNPVKAFSILFILSACVPYAKGPVLSIEEAQNTFRPIVEFMDVEPGMAVADVGAGSGALTVIMATQLDSCAVYIQDIDRKTLQQGNVNKMITHYSGQLGYDLGERNQFHLVYGTPDQPNLPNESIDVMYSNATIHVFDKPDAMLQDLRKKLKPTGNIFIRDGFKGENGKGEFCSSKKCAKRLLSIDEFLVMMEQNGYRLIKQSPNVDGYPLFGFKLSD